MTGRRLTIIATAVMTVVLALVGGDAAWAFFTATGTQNASATVDAFPPAGSAPTASITTGTATVSFTAVTTTAGHAATSYTVRRYASGSTTVAATLACTPTTTPVTCTEASVPSGTWQYTYTPLLGTNWTGSESTKSTGVTYTADTTPPTINGAVLATVVSGAPIGFVAPGGSYYIYANASDANGIQSITASVVSLGTPGSPVPLTAGSYTANGTAYGYRSGLLTAGPSVADGSKSFTVTATDPSANTATFTGSATVDGTKPTIAAAVIGTATTTGYVAKGATYYVYANVSDVGSGVASVTANVSPLTTGATSVALQAGTFTVNGSTYAYRSAAQIAGANLAEGSVNLSLSAADALGNTNGGFSFTAVVDNTAPLGLTVSCVNSKGSNVTCSGAAGNSAGDVPTITVTLTSTTTGQVFTLTATASSTTWTTTSGGVKQGLTYNVSATQSDAAGNIATASGGTFQN